MIDDLAEMMRQRGRNESTAPISLNLDLVRYSKQAHPDVPTGYPYYFFSVGDMSTIPADYLMMEEGPASSKTVDAVRASGKKAIVWTVNTDQSIERAVSSPVDGIITDYPTRIIRSLSLQAGANESGTGHPRVLLMRRVFAARRRTPQVLYPRNWPALIVHTPVTRGGETNGPA